MKINQHSKNNSGNHKSQGSGGLQTVMSQHSQNINLPNVPEVLNENFNKNVNYNSNPHPNPNINQINSLTQQNILNINPLQGNLMTINAQQNIHHIPNSYFVNSTSTMNNVTNTSFFGNTSMIGANSNTPGYMMAPNMASTNQILVLNTPFSPASNNVPNQNFNVQNSQNIEKQAINTKITPAQKLNLVASTIDKTNKRKWVAKLDNTDSNCNPGTVTSYLMNSMNSPNNNSTVDPKFKNRINKKYNSKEHKISNLNDSIEDNQVAYTKKLLVPKCSLRSHMDSVRGVYFSSKNPILASVSEDCMIKLWDTRVFSHSNESSHIEPYYTLRYHSGPLFTVTGSPEKEGNGMHIFTAGSEGNIRVWNIPHPDVVDSYGACGHLKYSCGIWNAHQDVIWELNHHPTEVTFFLLF